MRLESLELTKEQEKSLEKKKIISVEAMLRIQPLHYWDFSEPLPLMVLDTRVREKLNGGLPFAMTGICSAYSVEHRDHMAMVKLRVKDDQTGNTLYVNIMATENLKITLLEQNPEHEIHKPVLLPQGVAAVNEIPETGVNAKCVKQISELNRMAQADLRQLAGLKTGGVDSFSRIDAEQLGGLIGCAAYDYIMTLFPRDRAAVCMKWMARGLKTELAVRKVMFDSITLKDLLYGKHLIVGGAIRYNEEYASFSILNPAVISSDIQRFRGMNVQYSQMKGFGPDEYAGAVNQALRRISSFDTVPHGILENMKMPSLKETARLLHHPSSWEDVQCAKKRIIFDDLLYLAVKLRLSTPECLDVKSPEMPKTGLMQSFIGGLPYALTMGQKQAIETISSSMSAGKQVRSLVQGDVGTGKTCVAFATMLQAAENGYQAALAAPYTTLAWQHYRDISKIAKEYGLKAVLLTSEATAAQKRKILKEIETGEANLIVGTHSIFADSVHYKNLGLIIEDEEHKFGVIHRESFEEKGVSGCHKITMSATPIPKSLAETLYGSSSGIITITDKPAERLPVKTAVTGSDAAAAKEIVKQVRLGHQAYIVCPAIEKNEKTSAMASIEAKEEMYRDFFYGPDRKKADGSEISMKVLTGKMKSAEKTAIMEDFAAGKIDVLMSTTVIEVGMNVPNATIIVITGADRFGFSTLHQLRGRVGRGKDQAYCVLQTDQPNEKLEFMRQTKDGFEIAEKDLELRGPGSLFGEKQTGSNYFINLMLSYPKVFEAVKKIAKKACETKMGRKLCVGMKKFTWRRNLDE